MKKQRKPRTKKADRSMNYDLCSYCGCANCDTAHSIGNDGYAMAKIQDRLHSGKCVGCGKEKCNCSCKSKLGSGIRKYKKSFKKNYTI